MYSLYLYIYSYTFMYNLVLYVDNIEIFLLKKISNTGSLFKSLQVPQLQLKFM